MSIRTLLAASHLGSAALGSFVVMCATWMGTSAAAQAGAALVSALLIVLGSIQVSAKFEQGLHSLLSTVLKGQNPIPRECGIREIVEVKRQLHEQVQRWSAMTASARAQTRDVEQLVAQFERRGERGVARSGAAAKQLRGVLAGISHAMDSGLRQLLSGSHEVAGTVAEIAQGADDQNDAISKTTTYVEQFSARIDAVSKGAEITQQAIACVRDIAQEAEILVDELDRGMVRAGSYLDVNEERLLRQAEHSREIGSMIQTIDSISSRTDLLALNASIESVRAGEHGRGFAIVAEEVHKLAEQAAQATREVAGLIDSTQVETQESLQLLTQERADLARAIEHSRGVLRAVEQIRSVSAESGGSVADIVQAAGEQSLLTQEVTQVVDRIATISKTMRGRAEKASWTSKALSKLTQQFESELIPLKSCSDLEAPPQLASELTDSLP